MSRRGGATNPGATDSGFCSYPIANFDCDGNSLRPIFTAFPSNAEVDACDVPNVDEAVVEAMYSPAPAFEATYNDNDCYETDMEVVWPSWVKFVWTAIARTTMSWSAAGLPQIALHPHS